MRRASNRAADDDKTRSTRGGCISHQSKIQRIETDPAELSVCAISQLPLSTDTGGVMVCNHGHLFNSEVLKDFVHSAGQFSSDYSTQLQDKFRYLRESEVAIPAVIRWQNNTVSCPITRTEASGKNRFVVLWRCGCVMSRKGIANLLRECPSADCPSCGHDFDREHGVVDLTGVVPRPRDLALSLARIEAPVGDCVDQGKSKSGRLTIHDTVAPTSIHKKTSSSGSLKRPRPQPMPQPLPRVLTEGWERLESRSQPGKVYYRNRALGVTQWEPPVLSTEGKSSTGAN